MSVTAQDAVIDRLLASDEPAIRYRTLVEVLGCDENSPEALRERASIRACERVRTLLSGRSARGRVPGSAYAKWTGDHWVLATLAELRYPPGDADLFPMRDHVYDVWLSDAHTKESVCTTRASTYGRGIGVPIVQGRARRCGSQEGNALWASLALGIADDRADRLAANLIRWQWPDGGWNCDRNPNASHSSFHETFLPLRALSLHARITGNRESRAAAERAADVFLKRRLFRRLSDNTLIHAEMAKLHYPAYWHYDVLRGLTVMAEAGFIGDPRCAEALDLLETKRLPDGGFPAEGTYYRVVTEPTGGGSLVGWGGTSHSRMNEFATVEALAVLRAAGRPAL